LATLDLRLEEVERRLARQADLARSGSDSGLGQIARAHGPDEVSVDGFGAVLHVEATGPQSHGL
jgi:hypothetical protein